MTFRAIPATFPRHFNQSAGISGAADFNYGSYFLVFAHGSVIWGATMRVFVNVGSVQTFRISLWDPAGVEVAWKNVTVPANSPGVYGVEFDDVDTGSGTKQTVSGAKFGAQDGASETTCYCISYYNANFFNVINSALFPSYTGANSGYGINFDFAPRYFIAGPGPVRPTTLSPIQWMPIDPIVLVFADEVPVIGGGDLAGGPRFRVGMDPERNSGPRQEDGSLQSDMQIVTGVQNIATFDGGTVED